MAPVLVVDDSYAVRTIVKCIARQAGHTVLEADDGELGLKIIRMVGCPLVVVMSYAMRHITGAEAMEIIAANTVLAHFHEYVFTSGRDYDECFAQVNTRLPHPAPFLRKPFTASAMASAINTAAARIAARAN